MASLKELHQLVHGLSKAEQRQVSLFINGFSGKAKNNYLQQLDNLKSIAIYDEKELKTVQKNIQVKRLSEFNTNLFDIICKSLSTLDTEDNLSLTLQKNNILAEILMQKKQYKQAEKVLQKNISTFTNYGADEIILQSHKLLYKLSMRTQSNFEKIITNTEYKIELNQKNANESEYIKLNFELNSLYRTSHSIRTKEESLVFLNFLNHRLLQRVENAKSNYAKHYFYMIKIPLLYIIGKPTEALALSEEATAFTQTNFDLKIDPIPYLLQLIRYLNLQTNCNETKQVEHTIKQIESTLKLLPKSFSKTRYSLNILDAKLCTFLIDKEYEKGVMYFEKNWKQTFEENTKKVSRIEEKASLIARLYYLNGNYNEALKYCEIALAPSQFTFKDTVIAIHFLKIINHIRLKNVLLIPHAALSLKRLLKNEEKLHGPEKALLLFLEKMNNANNINNLHKNLESLKNTLNKELKKPFNNTFFNAGDYIIWIENELS